MTTAHDPLRLETDVLVIGGGLAGAWAAVAAAREGARVVLADKGYCGTSGVTAAAGPGHWWVAPEARPQAVAKRLESARGLGEAAWMERILDLTWRTLPTLAPYYAFPANDRGEMQYRGLRGPEYMRAMRALALDQGVTILDQSPALELLRREDGAVAGAAGWRRQEGRGWTARAGAVVLASGGVAFMSRLLGCHTNTGDGHLMAAEAGASLLGMEFATYYTLAAAGTTMTRSMSYIFGRFFREDGTEIDLPPGDAMRPLAAEMLKGKVYCRLDRTPQDIRERMPQVQPNFMLPFDRRGVDPYGELFEVTLRGEGTVRGVGGLELAGEDCRTGVPGLFAAGDTASRERVTGAISGGGNVNSAWALSSGQWAGQGAADHARRERRPDAPVLAIGGAGLRPTGPAVNLDPRALIAAVQGEMLPYDKAIFRTGEGLARSLATLDGQWRALRAGLGGEGAGAVKAREAAALTAVARWCCAAALERRESRGMHQRLDHPHEDPRLARRLEVGGLDTLWTRWGAEAAEARAAS
jgi:succinate dehydrogenase/fumarate reductase flavoprotein subunit